MLISGNILPLVSLLKNNDILLLTTMFFPVYWAANELTNLYRKRKL